MTQPMQMPDGDLLAWLGEIAREIDPPPPDAYAMGHDVFLLHRIDDELAALVADSRLDAAAVRGEVAAIRLLSFEGSALTIEIQLSTEGAGRTLMGEITAGVTGATDGHGGRVYLETPAGFFAQTTIDADGRFELGPLPDSLVRLRVEVPGSPPVTTTWVEL